MKTLGDFIAAPLGFLLLCTVVAAIVIVSGAYNVGASSPHWVIVQKTLHYATVRSVEKHAEGVVLPKGMDLRSLAFAQKSVGDFNEMCVTCHGAPGRKPDPWARGLHPRAPSLTDAAIVGHWTDAQIYWILKNGIKDTGMMAFGSSHDEEELWALTALVKRLPTTTPDEFHKMTEQAKATEGEDEHASPGSATNAPPEHT